MKHSLTIWFCRDELSLAMLFWEDMITLLSMLEVLLFLMSIWTFILYYLDLNIHATLKKITLRIMLGSIPHQKFCFYHLPTQGRAGIKLGDAWYVSNVSITFDCSMLLYYPFRMFMGFTLHFYIIFGTNLLTGGLARIVVFLPILVFRRKGISNGVQTEWNLRERDFWNKHDPEDLEWKSRNNRGSHEGARRAPYRWARPPPSWAPQVSTNLLLPPIYISTYPENIQEHHENLIPPPQPSVSARSHLGAFVGAPPEGESTMEGLYIISKACPMSCE